MDRPAIVRVRIEWTDGRSLDLNEAELLTVHGFTSTAQKFVDCLYFLSGMSMRSVVNAMISRMEKTVGAE